MKRYSKVFAPLFVFLSFASSLGGFFVFGKDDFENVFSQDAQRIAQSEQVDQAVYTAPEPYPNIISITPESDATDVLVDIEDPITVQFDRSVKNFFIDFRISPDISLTYQNDEEKTKFQLLPNGQLQPATQYTLFVWIKRRAEGNDAYTLLRSSRFTTLPPRPGSWSKDLALRLEEAKKYTRPKVSEGKYIDVNIDSQVMTLFNNGKLEDAFIVSSGKKGMDTPKGEFSIQNKSPRALSRRFGLFMPYWMAITANGEYGIHELPEWPDGYKEGASHLGIPVSHGCVRLGEGTSKKVYDWSDIGTRVIIY